MVLICAKEQWDWHLGSWGAETSAKQETIRSFVTPRGRERHEHVLFFYFYIHKDANSTIYRYMLHWSGDNQPGEPVLCLEHSGNALICNVSCKSCAKCGEIMLSERHLLFSLNSFKSGEVHKYRFKMFQSFIFVLAVLQKQLSPDVNLREKMFQMKTICISLNFESCWMPKSCANLLIFKCLWQMKTSCTGALQGVLHFCRQTCGSYWD